MGTFNTYYTPQLINKLSDILKPEVFGCIESYPGALESYISDIECAEDDQFEISGQFTASGNPYIMDIPAEWVTA